MGHDQEAVPPPGLWGQGLEPEAQAFISALATCTATAEGQAPEQWHQQDTWKEGGVIFYGEYSSGQTTEPTR